jgi:HPt (histidine-containing phosphotransfer) domain-containing protein
MSGIDPEDYRASAELFVRLAPGIAAQLRALMDRRDLDGLRKLAHRLVGTMGFVDPAGAAPAARVEAAIAGGCLEDLPALVADLEEELGRAARTLAEVMRGATGASPGGTNP